MTAKILLAQDWQKLKKRLEIELGEYTKEENNAPTILIKLLISAEDHRYFKHNGVDIIAILRAIWRRITRGKWEGASTIEMQLVRVLTQNYEFSFRRKTREVLLASLVDSVVPKNKIPCIYLRNAYYGWKMNGLTQAYKKLNVDPKTLTIEQGAGIIARIKYPEPKTYSVQRENTIKKRTKHIIHLYRKHSISGIYSELE